MKFKSVLSYEYYIENFEYGLIIGQGNNQIKFRDDQLGLLIDQLIEIEKAFKEVKDE